MVLSTCTKESLFLINVREIFSNISTVVSPMKKYRMGNALHTTPYIVISVPGVNKNKFSTSATMMALNLGMLYTIFESLVLPLETNPKGAGAVCNNRNTGKCG